jgi:hypothetical protein
MTVYGQSDVNEVTVGGAGHSHVRAKNEAHMKVDCAVCEPKLREMGWVGDPRQIPLTYDERLDAENAEREMNQYTREEVVARAREAAAAVRSPGRPARGKGAQGGAAG